MQQLGAHPANRPAAFKTLYPSPNAAEPTSSPNVSIWCQRGNSSVTHPPRLKTDIKTFEC